jgi:hypothetical protein
MLAQVPSQAGPFKDRVDQCIVHLHRLWPIIPHELFRQDLLAISLAMLGATVSSVVQFVRVLRR